MSLVGWLEYRLKIKNENEREETKMKLQVYHGANVVTTENLREYVYPGNTEKLVGDRIIINLRKKGLTILLPMEEARKYGQKKEFNYARGINLMNVKDVIELIENDDYFKKRMDIAQLKKDVKNNEIRGIGDRDANSETKTQKPEPTPIPEKLESVEGMPFDEVYALMDRMSEIYSVRLAVSEQKIDDLIAKFDEVIAKVDALGQAAVIPNNESEIENTVLTPIILKEDASYKDWCKAIGKAVGLILGLKREWTESSVLHTAYDRIRAQYGIVWEQEAKEFKQEYGRGPVNTRELCYWMETTKKNYKNLLIGKLNTIYSECRREAAKVS